MQERVRLVKGTISITSSRILGTEINVRVPLSAGESGNRRGRRSLEKRYGSMLGDESLTISPGVYSWSVRTDALENVLVFLAVKLLNAYRKKSQLIG